MTDDDRPLIPQAIRDRITADLDKPSPLEALALADGTITDADLDNVRQLRPAGNGPLAGDDAELTALAATIAAAAETTTAIGLEPTAILVTGRAAQLLGANTVTELLGAPVIALDQLPGDDDVLIAYAPHDPTPPPRKAHG